MRLSDMPIADALRQIVSMPRAEIVTRHNAIDEIKSTIGRALDALGKQTSDEVASIAGVILNTEVDQIGPPDVAGTKMNIRTFHTYAQMVAGSALAQADGPEVVEHPLLPLDDVSSRSLSDAAAHGQARPETVPSPVKKEAPDA